MTTITWSCADCDHDNPHFAQFCGSCGTSTNSGAPEPRKDHSGEILNGHLKLVRRLGEGGMGEVYLAHDLHLDREVAVKLLAPELVYNARAWERMWQEGQTLGRINDPNVVKVHELFEATIDESRTLAMAMELVTGGDLRARLDTGPIPWRQAVAWASGVLSGLSAIHAAGLVHRDIKPANILISKDETPKVTDLGIARDLSGRMQTRTGMALGTFEYMSPEQVQGVPVDERCDLYAVGLLLYELVLGQGPYHGMADYEVPVAQVKTDIDLDPLQTASTAGLTAVVQRALQKDRDQRFRTAEEMRLALGRVLVVSKEVVLAAERPLHQKMRKKKRRGAPAMLVGLGVILAWVAYQGFQDSSESAEDRAYAERLRESSVSQREKALEEKEKVAEEKGREAEEKGREAEEKGREAEEKEKALEEKEKSAKEKRKVVAKRARAAEKKRVANEREIEEQKVRLAEITKKRQQEEDRPSNPYDVDACLKGDRNACIKTSHKYSMGVGGVEQDAALAARLRKRGCELGEAVCCNDLGWMYGQGKGVSKSKRNAVVYYTKACEMGFAASCNNLGWAFYGGTGTVRDRAKARRYFEKSCAGSKKRGCRGLGFFYYHGLAGPKNRRRAEALFTSVCNTGDKKACKWLRDGPPAVP